MSRKSDTPAEAEQFLNLFKALIETVPWYTPGVQTSDVPSAPRG